MSIRQHSGSHHSTRSPTRILKDSKTVVADMRAGGSNALAEEGEECEGNKV